MVTTITLPSHIKSWIEHEIEAGRFASEEQAIVEALERMADDRSIPPELVDELVAAPRAQIERGEGREWTSELRRRIKEEALKNAGRGHEVRDEIKY